MYTYIYIQITCGSSKDVPIDVRMVHRTRPAMFFLSYMYMSIYMICIYMYVCIYIYTHMYILDSRAWRSMSKTPVD